MGTPTREKQDRGREAVSLTMGTSGIRAAPEAEAIRKQARILVVDDDPDMRESLCMLLEVKGHQTAQARDGSEGLARFREGGFDLVISDFHMVGMNGLEMVKLIKALNPDVPVIMASGEAHQEEREHMRAAGAMAVLVKPFEMDDLESAIIKALERK